MVGIGGGEGVDDEVISKPLKNQKLKLRKDKAKAQKSRRDKANLAISGALHLPVHISNQNSHAMIRFFNKSVICWADAK